MISKLFLQRKECKFLSLKLPRAVAVVAKSVTFLLLIKKILTTPTCQIVASKRGKSSPMTKNPNILTTRMTLATSTKTKGKLFDVF